MAETIADQKVLNIHEPSKVSSFFEAFFWSGLTVGLAFLVGLVGDFIVKEIYTFGRTTIGNLLMESITPNRIYEISIVLLSALIIEHWFSIFRQPKLDASILVFQFLVLLSIAVFFALHNFHTTNSPHNSEHVSNNYQQLLDHGNMLHMAERDIALGLDTVEGKSREHLLTKRSLINDSLAVYWDQVQSIILQNKEQVRCTCKEISMAYLALVFFLSIGVRSRMLYIVDVVQAEKQLEIAEQQRKIIIAQGNS